MGSWNLGTLFEMVADVVGDREAVVADGTRLRYAQLDERANQLAHALRDLGVGPGDHVGLLLRNGPEYLEAMLAAFKLRAISVNLNTRYTADELRYLLADALPVVVIHEPDLAERLGVATAELGLDARLLPRGSDYEAALAAAPSHRPDVVRSGDDRYVLYTGGTTGLPKGVVWRHEDLLFAALGGGSSGGDPADTPSDVAEHARHGRSRCLPASPFTHGTAQWMALTTLLGGGTVLVDGGPAFAADRLWTFAEQEGATLLAIVGDAFGRPLADALRAEPDRWQLDELLVILSGGAVLSPGTRRELLEQLPWAVVVDGYGTSETGGQGQMPSWAGQVATSLPRFHVDENTAVLDDAGRPAPPGSGLIGRLARRGRIPLGYHGDPAGSAETFTELHGQRWAVPGDLARVEADGSITLLGRGSSSINTGGEKVFPEEVEIVLKDHAAVFDAVVVGVPDDRFGERVAAVVQGRPGVALDPDDLDRHCRGHLAPFKVPRRLVVVDELARRPSGKADLAWAREQVQGPPG
ncbi:AMP-binding protein [Aquihabitans sp. G128]|uniref:AMP-binding protein n=1 Tax=Aquihabitans sp. G128 TaxID=2849779 RepID=UPI001C2302C7|nr:AMP-binding protein [Aquihabitans sp. G128]QXC62575.1 AMP-binding protein [Aquihabitans sp. G128]